jgi:hypothetical protein
MTDQKPNLRLCVPEPSERVSRHGVEVSKWTDSHGTPARLGATEDVVSIGTECSPIYLERDQVAALVIRLVAWLSSGSIRTGGDGET